MSIKLLNNHREFYSILPKYCKIVSLDVGLQKTGVAISDKHWQLAVPIGCVFHNEWGHFRSSLNEKQFKSFIKGPGTLGIICGNPLDVYGNNSRQSMFTWKILKQWCSSYIIGSDTNCFILWKDERFSSVYADNVFKNRTNDHHSAALLLQEYLDFVKSGDVLWNHS